MSFTISILKFILLPSSDNCLDKSRKSFLFCSLWVLFVFFSDWKQPEADLIREIWGTFKPLKAV